MTAIRTNLPVYENEDQEWDSGAAIKRVKDWASDSDGNIDFGKYKKAFFWVDSEGGDKQGDYKLPFADVTDGELKAIWRGVAAAMGALMGARGGMNMPDEDKMAVHAAISVYYKKFGKEPPMMGEEDNKSVVADEEEEPDDPSEEKEPKDDTKSFEKVYTKAEFTEKSEKEFTAVASSAIEDRHGEVIDQSGWDLKNFKKNPVLLWAHDHYLPAIGHATKVWTEGGKLMFKGIWSSATELGRACQQLVQEGTLNSFSVGFMPFEMDGNTYIKQELLEISLVNVPANPDAMMAAYKSLKKSGFGADTIKQLGIPTEVLDKIEKIEKDYKVISQKVEDLVKAQENKDTSAAPLVRSTKEGRTKQSLIKAIARTTDKALEEEKHGSSELERKKALKIIKRAAEILSKTV